MDEPTPRVFMMIDTGWAYTRAILRGIRQYIRGHKPWIISIEPPTGAGPSFEHWRADGVIAQVTSVSIVDQLLSYDRPTVNISGSIARTPFLAALPDNHAVGELGARYFLERGYHDFAFAGLPQAFSGHRRDGFAAVLAAHGRRPRELPWTTTTPELTAWLKSLPKPCALMGANDTAALRVMEACLEAGIAVPTDLAVLGVDNDDLFCELSYKTLSSVPIPFERIGYEAARLLAESMANGHRPSDEPSPRTPVLVKPMPVVTRQSTDATAYADEAVDAVTRHIREHLGRPIRVGDLIERVASESRRSLERRFRHVTGRTILQEITRCRIDRACTLIGSGEWTMKQVARQSGFASAKQLSATFRKVTGQSPTEYQQSLRPPGQPEGET